MVDITELYLLNLVITIILTVATLYRVKIERDHTKAIISELTYEKKLKDIHSTLIREKNMILEIKTAKDIKDLYDFLLECLKDADT
jgi:hypothetical protein